MNAGRCVEGVIDLLLIDPDDNRCLLIDWKTNRIEKSAQEELRQSYKPQIAAYWKAVREITKLEVEAGIFATAIGRFLVYNAEELEAEWERLRALPAETLTNQLLAD
jgi:hypothetical protein